LNQTEERGPYISQKRERKSLKEKNVRFLGRREGKKKRRGKLFSKGTPEREDTRKDISHILNVGGVLLP